MKIQSRFKKAHWLIPMFAGLALILLILGACSNDMKINGMSIKEAFKDPKVGALAVAAARGDVAEMDRLVNEGANVNGLGEDHTTPLAMALATKNTAGIKRLLELGADPNNYVTRRSDQHTIYLLMLIAMGGGDNYEILKLFLDHKGNPNTIGSEERSLLMACIDKPRYVKLLIEHGADINYLTNSGFGLLMAAVLREQWETAKDLLTRGITNKEYDEVATHIVLLYAGSSPIGTPADRQGSQEVLAMLKERGVRIPSYAELDAIRQKRNNDMAAENALWLKSKGR